MKAPPLTVVMSVYNGQSWLSEAIDSVLAQTFSDFQFLILDDGSSDNSLEILQSYSRKDGRIKLVQKANTGLTDTLNLALTMVVSPLCARIDSDDVYERDKLKIQMECFFNQQELVLVGCAWQEIDAQGKALGFRSCGSSHNTLLKRLRNAREFFPHSSAMFRTQSALAVGSYRKVLKKSQDRDLWLRLSTQGQLAASTDPLVRIRIHQDSISKNDGGLQQFLDCRAATVAHHLKIQGYPDPLDCDSAKEFLQFIRELNASDAAFSRDKLFSQYAQSIPSSSWRPLLLLGKLVSSGDWKSILQRLGIYNLAKDWARKWLMRGRLK